MLYEITNIPNPLVITLDRYRQINSIGIGYTNGINFNVVFNDIDNTTFNFQFTENGLYSMNKTINASQLTITTDATFIGRIGAGIGCNIPTAIPKEPAFCSSMEPRITLAGQSIQGRGGYYYKKLSLDSRYKIDEFILNEIKDGYEYIGMNYPFFIDLTIEAYKLPFKKLYANELNQNNLSFESGVKKYLYSRRWEFEERF